MSPCSFRTTATIRTADGGVVFGKFIHTSELRSMSRSSTSLLTGMGILLLGCVLWLGRTHETELVGEETTKDKQ